VVDSRNFGDKTHTVKLKISAAIGSYPDNPRIRNSADFLNIADEILGHAKEEGGNRIYSSLNVAASQKTADSDKEADITDLKEKIWKLTARGNQSVVEAIFAFAKTIEMKDHYTGDHVSDTIHYAARIAEKLKLPEHTIEMVRHAAALHDLGKIGIPENILHKKSKLSDEEYEVVKKHPQIGVDIIRPIHFLHKIIPAMLHHHERWDGGGYPYGLKGSAIPLGARIVAVADAYQAMISDRPYRKAISQEDAVDTLKKNAGTQFDPEIVDAFLDVLSTESKSSKYKK
jgi:HD-GYP domain-containing protein (c-di-GMP phosphodiesterase class II)